MSRAEIPVAAAVLIWVLVRQRQSRRFVLRSTLMVPAILTLLGAVALLRFARHGAGIGSSAAAWIVVDMAAGVITGVARAATVRLFERDGVVWCQGRRLTIGLWAVSIAIRVAIAAAGSRHGASVALDRSLLLSFGLSLAAQYLVIAWRAAHRVATADINPPDLAAHEVSARDVSKPVRRGRGAIVAVGGWASDHRGLVISCWVMMLIGATVGHRALGGNYSDTLTISSSTAQQGLNLLREHDSRSGGQGGQVVFVATSGTIQSHANSIKQVAKSLQRLPDVLAVSDPLQASSVSSNGRTAYAAVNFSANPQSLGHSYLSSVENATAAARRSGLQVSYGGALGQAIQPKAKDSRSELIGIVVAFVALLIGFGSLLAAGLPLLSAILAVISAIGLLGMLASAITLGTSSPTLATMMGLGVGIDYALFLTTRYRQRLIDGDLPEPALASALQTSGRAILVAATTVVIAMLGLYASGISYIGKLGLAAAVAVAVAATAALTLVPALLAVAGPRIDRYVARRAVAEPPATRGRLHDYVNALARHPWRYACSGIALLLVIAIPALSMNLGHVGPGNEPTSFSERQAYDALSAGFGAGANGPLTIVLDLDKAATTSNGPIPSHTAATIETALHATPDVAAVTPFEASQDGTLLVSRVIPDSGPEQPATQTLVNRLQNQTLPDQLHDTGITGYVTGTTAAQLDFQRTVSSHLLIIIGVVLAAAFLLLLLSFRSPVLAAKAAILNLLSTGVAYGVMVAIFQWGWGAKVLGLPGKVPIESYVPMIIFAIVFGLSMDYEVFLLSRIREHWLRTADNRTSVAAGLSETARVISCAAIIMASVFLAFLLSTNVVVKMFAVGLGVSVIVDATIIRLLIVPALMFVFGASNWWTPCWLERLLPTQAGHPAEPRPALPAHEPKVAGAASDSDGG
jgi:RND superfamily putative drug exporter